MNSQDYSEPSTSQFSNSSENNPIGTISKYSKYLKLLHKAEEIGKNETFLESCKTIHDILETTEELFPRKTELMLPALSVTQMYLDAKVLQTTSVQLEQLSDNVDVGEGVFNLNVFAEQFRLKSLDEDGNPSFDVLAKAARPAFHNSLPYWSPLLGSFDYAAEERDSQQRKVRQPRKRDEVVDKKEPEKVTQADKTQKSVEERIQHTYSMLKRQCKNNRHQPINYTKLFLDPNSFADTVENLFHISFLVKDGHAKLELDGADPVISPVLQGTSEPTSQSKPTSQSETSSSNRKQFVFPMDAEIWHELTDDMKIIGAM